MSKITVALGSFIIGACSMLFLFSGNHAPAFAQSAPTQATASELNGEPTMPGIRGNLSGSTFTNVRQPLDGLLCKGCNFENATLTYAGGTFTLTNCKFSGTTRVMLSGAAANTVSVLPLLIAISKGVSPAQPTPNKPIEKEAIAKQLTTVSFSSPYGQ